MQGYSFEEVILQGKRTKKYRLAVRFEDPQYGPLALFLNSEAGVFGAEIAEALEQAQAAMGQTEFTGNLCTAVITPESVIVYRNTEDEEEAEEEKTEEEKTAGEEGAEEKSGEKAPRICELPTAEFAELLAEWREHAAEVKKKNVAERRKAAKRRTEEG